MDDTKEFFDEIENEIRMISKNEQLREDARDFLINLLKYGYTYHFTWMGFPIIQIPQDIIAMQEIIFKVKPDLIIETGIARGGSLVFYSSMLELLGNGGRVLGIDLDIREHNRIRIEQHTMSKNIDMFEGSSTDKEMIARVEHYIKEGQYKNILVALDSCHTHEHVAKELDAYSAFVTKGSYLVVFDTISRYFEGQPFVNKQFREDADPLGAVLDFIKTNDRFEIDESIDCKLLLSVSPSGYLKCIK